MNAKQLKNALLQHAIQGRLVPQDPGDEPADVLLQRIRAEKEQLIKEGKIKKQKPLPPITEEEKPFAIPDSWQWVRLGEICLSADSGWSPKAEPFPCSQGKWGVLKVSAVSSGYFIGKENKQLIDQTDIPSHAIIKKNDFLISRANTSQLIGMCAIVEIANNLIMSDKIVRLHFTNNIYKKYIHFINNSVPYIRIYYSTNCSGTSSSMKNISRDVIYNLPIPLPPLAEQQRIVARLEELLPDVEAYGTAQERLTAMESSFPQQLRKSLLQEAIQGRLVPQNPADESADVLLQRIRAEKEQLIKEGKIKKQKPLPPITEEEKPFAIPDSWQWVRLGNLSTYLQRGRSPKYSSSSSLSVISQKCVRWGRLDISLAKYVNEETISKYSEDRFLKKEDILLNSTGTGTLGRMCIFNNELYKCVADSHVTVIRLINKYISNKYVTYLFENKTIQDIIISNSSGSTNQKELNLEIIKNFLIPLPPLAEQQRIVARLEELLPLCDGLLSAGGKA